MSFVKKRTADGLLKAAKRLTKENPRDFQNAQETASRNDREFDSRNFQIIEQQKSRQRKVKIVENKRSHQIPEYIDLPPSHFMAWYITSTGAKRKASNMLLKYLKHKYGENIPTDYRTLLRTPVKPVPKNITLGNYVHLGVRQALMQLMSEAGTVLSTNIFLQFFVDGLLISRSTKEEAWIIMMNVRKASQRRLIPKVIGVHYDEKKPSNFNEFLWPFVTELLELLESGFVSNGTVLKLNILNFVLDAPSRTSCKCVKHINGYYGCGYCLAEGDSIDHRMAFLDLEAPLRNDYDYRSRKYDDDYHKRESVLELLPIDMVDAFPPDYLHCVLLGVVNWILKYICDTPKTLSVADHLKIGKRIEEYKETQPKEFQRNLRSFIENLGLMKGTEFRQYLLFVFPLLLKGIVSGEILANFVKLQIASTIFSHKRFDCYYNEADELMRMFILEFAEVYHPRHVVYVVHSLCHMKKFVELYGPWDNFSTFEYETQNSTIKNLLHGNVMPLTQITNRIVEIYNPPKYDFDRKNADIEIKDRQDDGSFSKLKYYDLTFSNNEIGQNFVLLKTGVAVKLVYIEHDHFSDKVKLTGKPFKHRSSVYSYVDTMRFNIFQSEYEFNNPITFEVSNIDGKLWKIDINNSSMSAYFPLYVEDGKSFSRGHNPQI